MIEYKTRTIYYAIFNGITYYKQSDGYYRTNKKGCIPALHHAVWEFHGNKIIKGYDIHHKDFDKDNNDIENLQQLSHEEHAKIHYEHNDVIHRRCKKCGNEFTTGNTINPSSMCDSCKELQLKNYKYKWTQENREKLNKNFLEKYHSDKYREIRICELCGKEFSTYKYGPQKLCSRSCAAKSKYKK
ncbi:hypothetical protein RSJ22_12655 [Clostridium botulinum]|uniref:HNH endonuclease signature motif containing protein n=1 Tax=Clostridium botulinum TaxID=1491 RepID=UPI000C764B65|nr:HNH endonuclease signature motif containing protein [Clostridium botulinum]AUN22240.1 hypothetical protein RSJ22_12655 [Clostridium botulinum]